MSTTSNAASVFSPSQISTTSSSSSSSSSSTSSTAQAAGANSSQQLAGNFNTFLQLLTTQLQNQNPLDPLDTNQFTQQLVEFASVEQQIEQLGRCWNVWVRCMLSFETIQPFGREQSVERLHRADFGCF